MASSPCFGSYAYYKRAIHTRFPFDSGLSPLVMRSTHKLAGSFFNRHAVEVLQPLPLVVDIWFQFYFTPLTGVLFTVPSRYWFTIGLKKYVALPVSSGKFTQAIRVLRYSRTIKKLFQFRLRGFHPLGPCVPARSATETICNFLHIKVLNRLITPE